jgi:hypothetical protein
VAAFVNAQGHMRVSLEDIDREGAHLPGGDVNAFDAYLHAQARLGWVFCGFERPEGEATTSTAKFVRNLRNYDERAVGTSWGDQ